MRVVAGVAAGSVAFVSIGVLLGTVLPSARSAQAIGLLLFFPSFLLGVGGPPPAVMGDALEKLSGMLPLALVTNSVREPWLGMGNATGSLVAVVALARGGAGAGGSADLAVTALSETGPRLG